LAYKCRGRVGVGVAVGAGVGVRGS